MKDEHIAEQDNKETLDNVAEQQDQELFQSSDSQAVEILENPEPTTPLKDQSLPSNETIDKEEPRLNDETSETKIQAVKDLPTESKTASAVENLTDSTSSEDTEKGREESKSEDDSTLPEEKPKEAKNIDQQAFLCEVPEKFKLLLGLLEKERAKTTLIYSNSRLANSWLEYKLNKNGYKTLANKSESTSKSSASSSSFNRPPNYLTIQSQNEDAAKCDKLIINFDIPSRSEDYFSRMEQLNKENENYLYVSFVCDQYAEFYQSIQESSKNNKSVPKPLWFDKNLLKAEDKSGNPFDDKDSNLSLFRDRDRFSSSNRRTSSSSNKKPYQRGSDSQSSRSSDRFERSSGNNRRSNYNKPPRSTSDYKRTTRHHKDSDYNRKRSHIHKTPQRPVKRFEKETQDKSRSFSFSSFVKRIFSFFLPKDK